MRVKMSILATVVMVLVLLVALPAVAQTQDTTRYGVGAQASSPKGQLVRVTGVLQKQGITGYQYGSHVITVQRSKRVYALYGGRGINLNRYVGRRVTVVGKRVRGYPIDLGPPLLKVIRVRPAYPVQPLS